MGRCKWLSDDFSEICVNGDCPYKADYCPVTEYPEICKCAEFEEDESKPDDVTDIFPFLSDLRESIIRAYKEYEGSENNSKDV